MSSRTSSSTLPTDSIMKEIMAVNDDNDTDSINLISRVTSFSSAFLNDEEDANVRETHQNPEKESTIEESREDIEIDSRSYSENSSENERSESSSHRDREKDDLFVVKIQPKKQSQYTHSHFPSNLKLDTTSTQMTSNSSTQRESIPFRMGSVPTQQQQEQYQNRIVPTPLSSQHGSRYRNQSYYEAGESHGPTSKQSMARSRDYYPPSSSYHPSYGNSTTGSQSQHPRQHPDYYNSNGSYYNNSNQSNNNAHNHHRPPYRTPNYNEHHAYSYNNPQPNQPEQRHNTFPPQNPNANTHQASQFNYRTSAPQPNAFYSQNQPAPHDYNLNASHSSQHLQAPSSSTSFDTTTHIPMHGHSTTDYPPSFKQHQPQHQQQPQPQPREYRYKNNEQTDAYNTTRRHSHTPTNNNPHDKSLSNSYTMYRSNSNTTATTCSTIPIHNNLISNITSSFKEECGDRDLDCFTPQELHASPSLKPLSMYHAPQQQHQDSIRSSRSSRGTSNPKLLSSSSSSQSHATRLLQNAHTNPKQNNTSKKRGLGDDSILEQDRLFPSTQQQQQQQQQQYRPHSHSRRHFHRRNYSNSSTASSLSIGGLSVNSSYEEHSSVATKIIYKSASHQSHVHPTNRKEQPHHVKKKEQGQSHKIKDPSTSSKRRCGIQDNLLHNPKSKCPLTSEKNTPQHTHTNDDPYTLKSSSSITTMEEEDHALRKTHEIKPNTKLQYINAKQDLKVDVPTLGETSHHTNHPSNKDKYTTLSDFDIGITPVSNNHHPNRSNLPHNTPSIQKKEKDLSLHNQRFFSSSSNINDYEDIKRSSTIDSSSESSIRFSHSNDNVLPTPHQPVANTVSRDDTVKGSSTNSTPEMRDTRQPRGEERCLVSTPPPPHEQLVLSSSDTSVQRSTAKKVTQHPLRQSLTPLPLEDPPFHDLQSTHPNNNHTKNPSSEYSPIFSTTSSPASTIGCYFPDPSSNSNHNMLIVPQLSWCITGDSPMTTTHDDDHDSTKDESEHTTNLSHSQYKIVYDTKTHRRSHSNQSSSSKFSLPSLGTKHKRPNNNIHRLTSNRDASSCNNSASGFMTPVSLWEENDYQKILSKKTCSFSLPCSPTTSFEISTVNNSNNNTNGEDPSNDSRRFRSPYPSIQQLQATNSFESTNTNNKNNPPFRNNKNTTMLLFSRSTTTSFDLQNDNDSNDVVVQPQRPASDDRRHLNILRSSSSGSLTRRRYPQECERQYHAYLSPPPPRRMERNDNSTRNTSNAEERIASPHHPSNINPSIAFHSPSRHHERGTNRNGSSPLLPTRSIQSSSSPVVEPFTLSSSSSSSQGRMIKTRMADGRICVEREGGSTSTNRMNENHRMVTRPVSTTDRNFRGNYHTSSIAPSSPTYNIHPNAVMSASPYSSRAPPQQHQQHPPLHPPYNTPHHNHHPHYNNTNTSSNRIHSSSTTSNISLSSNAPKHLSPYPASPQQQPEQQHGNSNTHAQVQSFMIQSRTGGNGNVTTRMQVPPQHHYPHPPPINGSNSGAWHRHTPHHHHPLPPPHHPGYPPVMSMPHHHQHHPHLHHLPPPMGMAGIPGSMIMNIDSPIYSKRKCVPLKTPIPSRFQGDMEKLKNAPIPEFTSLVNFPIHMASTKQQHQHQQTSSCNNAFGDGHRNCVMCGQLCICSSNSSKKQQSNTTKGDTNSHKNSTTNENPRANPHHPHGYNPNNNTNSPTSTAIIPTQNKGLCTSCDVNVWIVVSTGLQIKWCKGCKNFRPWAAFGEKGLATKCVRCRDRQREKYALQKEEKEQKQLQLTLVANEDAKGDIGSDGGSTSVKEEDVTGSGTDDLIHISSSFKSMSSDNE